MTIDQNMPVLNAITEKFRMTSAFNIEKIVFVCIQHLMHTTIPLFQALIELGAQPNNIFLLGKQYSTCEAVVKRLLDVGIQVQELTPLFKLGTYETTFSQDVLKMWQNVIADVRTHNIDAIVVLDDGGRCLEFINQKIILNMPMIGIEQTTAGLLNRIVLNSHIPFIDVAASAAKTYLEADLIAEAIIFKLGKFLPQEKNNVVCGVVGLGVIGSSVAKKLISLGYNIIAYDPNNKVAQKNSNLEWAESLETLIKKADYIYGCTGSDITQSLHFEDLIRSEKAFISCTSEDKEFLSLLQYIQACASHSNIKFSPLSDVKWQLKNGAKITIAKGGFPVNFDKNGISVPVHKIQLTRSLLLAAIIQAIQGLSFFNEKRIQGRIMLHPLVQQFIAKEWVKTKASNDFHKKIITEFEHFDWIIKNSGGVFYDSDYIKACFSANENCMV
jgi:S-adenosylhomocysteine hydrolase